MLLENIRGSKIAIPGSTMNSRKTSVPSPADLTLATASDFYKDVLKRSRSGPVAIDLSPLRSLDYAGLSALRLLKSESSGITLHNLPGKFDSLLSFREEEARPQIHPEAPSPRRTGLEGLGHMIVQTRDEIRRFFLLLSDEAFHTFSFLRKHRGVYPGEVWHQLYAIGYQSFPIVGLITFLVGVTIALTSAAQLKLFGADIYLSYFVGIAMLRELVPLMTGIILAGKTGASITAEIATMKVLEEVDALKTMGLNPEKYLMVPRLLGMTIAVPLLTVLADFIGIAGGILVARFYLGTPPAVFFQEMMKVVTLPDFLIGLTKTMVFGWAVVLSSGFKGFSVKRGAEDVGRATTESVVLSISLIIVLDCVFALLLY